MDLPTSLPALSAMGWTTLGASLVGTIGSLPQWCKKDSGDSVRLAPGCDVSFKVTPAPLTLREEICLMGLWRPLSPDEAEHSSPAREWLAKCDPQHTPERAYLHYHTLDRDECHNLFSFSKAWTEDNLDKETIRRALGPRPNASGKIGEASDAAASGTPPGMDSGRTLGVLHAICHGAGGSTILVAGAVTLGPEASVL